MAKYQKYAEYQDSGVEWLGEIPRDWSILKLKFAVELISEKSQEVNQKYVGMENIASKNGKYIQTEEVIPEGISNTFKVSDVLFGKLRPYLAKSWLADFCGICSSELLVLRAKKIAPKFLQYYTLTDEFINQVDSSTYGSKMPRASWDFIGLLPIPICSFELSTQIANFLDHETAKIDTLIAKQEKLIELLKEKRQAVISHAVTKGLNPNVPMKDSGVEWLGEVPEHWELYKLKHACSEIFLGLTSKVDYVESDGVPLVRALNIKNGILDLSTAKQISVEQHEKLTKYRCAKRNDILLSKSGTIGTAAIVDTDIEFSIYESIFALRGKSEILLPTYLLYFIQSKVAQAQYEKNSVGMGVVHLNMPDIQEVIIPLPPKDEQLKVLKHVVDSLDYFKSLIHKAESAIQFMQERRTALISAAVTGKIDVRNWQHPNQNNNNNTELSA